MEDDTTLEMTSSEQGVYDKQLREEIIARMVQFAEEIERKKQEILDLRAYLDKLTKKYHAMPKDAEEIDRVLICSKHELGRKRILLATSDMHVIQRKSFNDSLNQYIDLLPSEMAVTKHKLSILQLKAFGKWRLGIHLPKTRKEILELFWKKSRSGASYVIPSARWS